MGGFSTPSAGGITKLSELTIDADKDWQAKEITNLKAIVASMVQGDIVYRGTSVLEKLAAGTLGQFLKTKGAAANPEWDSFDIFDKFREFIPWICLDGFLFDGTAGYIIEPRGTYLQLSTNNTTNSYARIRTQDPWYNLLATGKVVTVEFPIVYLYSNADQNIWLRMGTGTSTPPSETASHFGWKIIDGDLYASNADGTTQKIADTTVNLTTGEQRTRLKMVFNPDVDCKFYVDDILKATHTINLPKIATYPHPLLYFYILTLADVSNEIYLGRGLIQRDN